MAENIHALTKEIHQSSFNDIKANDGSVVSTADLFAGRLTALLSDYAADSIYMVRALRELNRKLSESNQSSKIVGLTDAGFRPLSDDFFGTVLTPKNKETDNALNNYAVQFPNNSAQNDTNVSSFRFNPTFDILRTYTAASSLVNGRVAWNAGSNATISWDNSKWIHFNNTTSTENTVNLFDEAFPWRNQDGSVRSDVTALIHPSSFTDTSATITKAATVSNNVRIRLLTKIQPGFSQLSFPSTYRVSFDITQDRLNQTIITTPFGGTPLTFLNGDINTSTSRGGAGGTNPTNIDATYPMHIVFRDDDTVDESPDFYDKGFRKVVRGFNSFEIELFDDGAGSSPSISLMLHRNAKFLVNIDNIEIRQLS